jgi:hypothetical protein
MLNLRQTYYIDLRNTYKNISVAYKKYHELHKLKHLGQAVKYERFKERIRDRELSVYEAINKPNSKKRA